MISILSKIALVVVKFVVTVLLSSVFALIFVKYSFRFIDYLDVNLYKIKKRVIRK